MHLNRNNLLDYLDKNKMTYAEHSHKALFTVEESKSFRGKMDGVHTKNLFLKDKKKNFFLLSCIENKGVNLKELRKVFNAGNLSFASPIYLMEILGISPGAVSPFSLINDKTKVTKFYLDRDILNEKNVNFHPLDNKFTLNLSTNIFLEFIKSINVKLNLIDLKVYINNNE